MSIPGIVPSGDVSRFVPGDPVSAARTNVPVDQLAERYEALLQILQANGIGENARVSATLEATTRVGAPVHISEPGVFGNASYRIETVGGVSQQSPSCFPVGVVARKSGDQAGGAVYLSAVPGAAGKLTTQRTRFGVGIGWVSGPVATDATGEPLYNFLVKIEWQNPFDDHRHYGARLTTSVRMTADQAGWLDASDAYWGDNDISVPENAVYGYLWKLDDQLKLLWPPFPTGSAIYLIDGVQVDVLAETPVLIDEYGIWWMDGGATPLEAGPIHDVYFLRSTFRSSTAMVTSLTPADSTITLVDNTGQPASVGDLRVSGNFTLTDDDGTNVSGRAFKAVQSNQLASGPVIDGIRTSTPSTVALTGGSTFVSDGQTYRSGLISLAVTDPSGVRTGPVEFVDLTGAQVDNTTGVVSTNLPNGLASSVTLRCPVPAISVEGSYTMQLRLLLWLRADGIPPDLGLSKFVFSPTGETPKAFSPSFTAIADVELSNVGTVENGQAVEFLTDPVTVTAGDLVHFKLSRGSADSFGGPVGILRATWELTPTA
jgi:hypothetical protein